MRAAMREERRDQRIGDGLQGSVCEGKDKRAPIQVVVGDILACPLCAAKVTKAERTWKRNAATTSLP